MDGYRASKDLLPSFDEMGLFGGALFILVGIVLAGFIIQNFVHDMKPQQVEEMFQQVKGVGELLGHAVCSVRFWHLFIEEIFFRGIVYGTLRQYIGVTWAIVVSGLIFGGMHADLVRMVR
jgi:membrane protease YdiL (CAAX protease family)